jgi:hypothetical protein
MRASREADLAFSAFQAILELETLRMNAIRKTVEFVSGKIRRPSRTAEAEIDRADREAVERALEEYRANPSSFISQEELEARLADRSADA